MLSNQLHRADVISVATRTSEAALIDDEVGVASAIASNSDLRQLSVVLVQLSQSDKFGGVALVNTC